MSSLRDSNMVTPRGESSRKKSSSRQPSQTEVKKSHKFSEGGLSCTSDCLFCGEAFQKYNNFEFQDMINKALYSKYSSSQNYYYTKDINEILAESRTAAVILFKDYLHADEEEEYLKRFYYYSEYDFKIRMLSEYYKFHNDIARIFILPVINIVNRFHDKKRRLEYIRVTKMLKEEQETQNPEAKLKEEKEKKNYSITDKVLADLDLTNPEERNAKSSKTNQEEKTHPKKKFIEKHKLIYKSSAPSRTTEPNKNNKGTNQSKDLSVSNTIHDLHVKLGEIISNSRSYNLDTNYLDNNEPQPNETMSNLSNFLLYLNKTSSASSNIDIPKPDMGFSASKLLSSALLTERPYRPELTQTTARTKQSIKGDLTSRISDSIMKALSPTSTKASAKIVRPTEKIPGKQEEKSSYTATLTRQNSQSGLERSKKVAGITKIKNFEEALKINMHNSHQKGSTQNSASRDQGLEKFNSNAGLKSSSRVSISKTPSKKIDDRPYETSRQQSQPFLSHTSRPSSRTKTRSTDMYSKALDLLLGSNQILLGNQTQKQETIGQGHRSTKSSFNFKVKTPSHQLYSQNSQNERSLGRDDLKLSSGFTDTSNKIISHKLASDRLYLQTEREIKKMGTFGSLSIPQREVKQAPLSDREMRRDYPQKDKDAKRNNVKGMKAVVVVPNETEMTRSGFNSSQGESRKMGLHKYAKSESRMKKVEGTEKIEIINDVKALLNGSGRSKIDHSPRRQTFIQNQNNIINVFVNSNQDRKLERNLTLKTERPGYPEALYQGEFDSLSRVFKSKSPNAEVLIKFNQTLPKKVNQQKNDSDYKNMDFSPLRVKHKDSTISQQIRASSDKSPLNINVGIQRRPGRKNEFEVLRRDLRFDNFEMSGRSKEKS